jgi:hypothetical protein
MHSDRYFGRTVSLVSLLLHETFLETVQMSKLNWHFGFYRTDGGFIELRFAMEGLFWRNLLRFCFGVQQLRGACQTYYQYARLAEGVVEMVPPVQFRLDWKTARLRSTEPCELRERDVLEWGQWFRAMNQGVQHA